MDGGCSKGLLADVPTSPCVGALTQKVLCSVECAFAFCVMVRLLMEYRHVPRILKWVIVSYTVTLVTMQIICGTCAAEVSTPDQLFVLWWLGHAAFSVGMAFRVNVFVQLVAVAGHGRVNVHWNRYMLFVTCSTIGTDLALCYLWGVANFFTRDPDVQDYTHRIGFVFFGLWLLVAVGTLIYFSHFVIKLVTNLAKVKAAETRPLVALRSVTMSSSFSIGFVAVAYAVIGFIPGSLRNEIVHCLFVFIVGGMLNLLRFIKVCSEVKKASTAKPIERGNSVFEKTTARKQRSKKEGFTSSFEKASGDRLRVSDEINHTTDSANVPSVSSEASSESAGPSSTSGPSASASLPPPTVELSDRTRTPHHSVSVSPTISDPLEPLGEERTRSKERERSEEKKEVHEEQGQKEEQGSENGDAGTTGPDVV